MIRPLRATSRIFNMAEIKTSQQVYDEFVKGIWKENPVFVQVLGMCPMLAVTNSAINALAMGGATLFVLLGSSVLVSLLRRFIPKQVRISTYILIIATFVTIVDFSLNEPDLHVNCIGIAQQQTVFDKHERAVSSVDKNDQ